jgi:hypothetical protein
MSSGEVKPRLAAFTGEFGVSPFVFKVAGVVIPPIGWALCAPAGHGRIGWIESRNKIRTIETVEFANTLLGGDLSIAELVGRIEKTDPFRALWLAEGLGYHFGLRLLAHSQEPCNALTEGEGRAIPENQLLMVHAGLALAFARHHWDLIGKTPSAAKVGEATRRIKALIDANSLPGYAGIGYEAWGMVTRFFYAKSIFPPFVDAIGTIDPEHAPNAWHGVGRSSYFFNFMPGWKEPWPAFPLIRRTARDRASLLNMLAGLASGMVIVNMRTPEILEAIVRERVSKLTPEETDAFAQGIACSMVMRLDTTPGDERAKALLSHTPEPDVTVLWERVIAGPGRQALETLQPLLHAKRLLDRITCYRPLDQILAEASRAPAP